MRKIIFILLVLQSLTAFSQFSDNFNDGLFLSGPDSDRGVDWTGDNAEFVINESMQLQLNSVDNHSPSQLKTHSSIVKNASWEFYVKMGFNPTSSNYSKIYIVSDEENLTGELNGLFIRIGYTDKNVCLMQSQKGGNNKTLIQGEKKRLDSSSVALNIKATLDNSGDFKLYSRLNEETDFTLEGTCKITETLISNWFGIVCTFTSTRNKLFFFDDFVVKTLEIEDPDPNLNSDFPRAGDILISEIMANPGSGSENPEYVELYNTTDKTFQLKNCLFFYDDKSYALPEKTIAPKSYFVLCKTTGTEWFGNDVNVNGVTSFPVLANTGKLLMFGNTQNELISWFEYSDQMYRDNTKKTGGWSLECIDLNNLSNTAENWSASIDPSGGTPGKENSVKSDNSDTYKPEILSTSLSEDNKVTINFSKPMNRNSLLDKTSYLIEDASYNIINVETNYPQGTAVTIQLNKFPPRGDLIELFLLEVKDLSNNKLEGDNSIFIGNAYEAIPSDVIINEILFNPPAGGNEYVELYNRSDKIIDLRYLSITSRKPSDGSFNTAYPLTNLPLFLHPEEYVVITKNRELVCQFFDCREESFFSEPENMPSLANTGGCAVLLNNITNEVVDEFYYNESMHSNGITNKKGVALERVDFDVPATEASNWLSATSQSGYGTPGYENSQFSKKTGMEIINHSSINVEYPVMDNGEYGIRYQLDKQEYNCRIFIYDASGRIVKTLANNEILGSNGIIYWNGKGDSNHKLITGIYIIYTEIFDTSGNVYKFKTPVVVK
ncbi:MAG: lamin tail domain-containing protein [Dysgonamonadaceae bacterium]|jgi:hypothetical protein|nr:lamin tail domain-containing protein [Dysgonamonadaceae bacterium]